MNLERVAGLLTHRYLLNGETTKFDHYGFKQSLELAKQFSARRSMMKLKIFVLLGQNIASLTFTSTLETG